MPNLSNINPHKAIPVCLGLAMAYAIISPYIEDRQMAKTESVKMEHMSCISAVCSEDSTLGRQCREIPKQLGITRLINEVESNRVVVELTGKQC